MTAALRNQQRIYFQRIGDFRREDPLSMTRDSDWRRPG